MLIIAPCHSFSPHPDYPPSYQPDAKQCFQNSSIKVMEEQLEHTCYICKLSEYIEYIQINIFPGNSNLVDSDKAAGICAINKHSRLLLSSGKFEEYYKQVVLFLPQCCCTGFFCPSSFVIF